MGELIQLAEGWQVCGTPPGLCREPASLNATSRDWVDATVPGTVADALRRAGDHR